MTPPKPLLTEDECSDIWANTEGRNEAYQAAAALGARKQRERDVLLARDSAPPSHEDRTHYGHGRWDAGTAIEVDGEEPATCDTCGSDDRATRYAISRPGTYEGPCENDWHNEPKEAPKS